MIPEFGLFALILALCFASMLAIVPLIGIARQNSTWISLARPLTFGQFGFIVLSFLCLSYAFISNDFSVVYVAENSNSQLPIMYRLAAVWGAHEGSILLWVLILSAWSAAIAVFSCSLPLEFRVRVLAIMAMISIGFLLFILITSNPFLRLMSNSPINGHDLNPLLQDIGLILHPPILYMGYVGFSVIFAFALAALLGGSLDAVWARWLRPWALIAWCFLTIGITTGSWWAYRELGWGGWWFWDPVENVSLLPWLVATALIHALAVTEKRDALKVWTVFLAIFTFMLCLMGTFLVRSGILTSVHAFANDPARGRYILIFLAIVSIIALSLYAWRAVKIRSKAVFSLLSRETLLLTNNLVLIVAALCILLGTLYPLALDALGLGKISVGAPYFNSIFIPLMVLLLILMGLGPACHWKYMPAAALVKRTGLLAMVSLTLGILLPFLVTGGLLLNVALALSLVFWVCLTAFESALRRSARRGGLIQGLRHLTASHYGMIIAHAGVAVVVAGIALTANYSIARDVVMTLGDTAYVNNYSFKFSKLKHETGPNYKSTVALIELSRGSKLLAVLSAEKRNYTTTDTVITQAAIDASIFQDLYVALGESLDVATWSFRLYYKPFVRWIWAGGFMIMLGGLCALVDRRYRLNQR